MTRNLKGFGLTKFGVRCDTVLDEDGNPVKVTQDILSETDQYYHPRAMSINFPSGAVSITARSCNPLTLSRLIRSCNTKREPHAT
jgi:hypothetical protein